MCVTSSSSLQEVQESLRRAGGLAAADLRLAAAALLLPAGREPGVPVRGGAEGGATSVQQPQRDQDQDQDQSSERTRNKMKTLQAFSLVFTSVTVDQSFVNKDRLIDDWRQISNQ